MIREHRVPRKPFGRSLVATFLASSIAAMSLGEAPAWAAKRRAAPAAAAVPQAADSGPADEKPAAQAQDTEKPTPKADPNAAEQDAVKPDAEGRVNFGTQKAGKGRITVKAPPGENVKVFLEGKLFGKAPQTINRVPPGDYVIEAVYPNGRTVSKAVTVSRDEEQVVELDTVSVASANSPGPRMSSEESDARLHKALVYGGGATIGFLALGLGLGFWTRSVESDFRGTPNNTSAGQAERDRLEKKGNALALGANISFALAGVSAIAAVIYAYPALRAEKKPKGEEAPPNLTFMILPTKDAVHAGLGFTF